ncbi:MAG: hypothetical protein ACOWWO_14985 [Peptococcaceae bacterium]
MTDEKFQEIVLQELQGIRHIVNKVETRLDGVETGLDGVETRLDRLETRLDGVETGLDRLETRLDGVETRLNNLEGRQKEIYQVVRAIEYSNQTGKAEMGNQNIRLARVEGKLKKAAKAFTEETEVEQALDL